MEPINLPEITIIKGCLFQDELEMYQNDAQSLPVDLTGKVFSGQIRKTPDSTSPLLATWLLTLKAPATSGVLQRHIHAADSAAMPVGTACYDIIETSLEREIWFTGKVTVKPGVTA